MIIDAHSHGFHGKYFPKLADMGGEWTRKHVEIELKDAKERPQYIDAAVRVAWLDKFGIDQQVVTPAWPSMDINLFPGDSEVKFAMARLINEGMAQLMEDSKGRLLTTGTVLLNDSQQNGPLEMERAINKLGLKGMSIYSNINGKPLDSPEFEWFWAKSNEMDIVVYIHPENPSYHPGNDYFYDYGLDRLFCWPFESSIALSRLVFSGIMKRFNNLKIVSHHLGGGMIPFFMGRINETYEMRSRKMGQLVDDSPMNYFKRFYYDTAVGGNAAAIKCACEVVGVDRLVFATDAPHGPQKGDSRLASYPGVVRSMGLSQIDNEKIFSGNIKRILKIA